MSEESGLQSHFEAIIGREVDAELDVGIALRERIGIYAIQTEGFITSRDIFPFGESDVDCSPASLLDISGYGRTGRDGTTQLFLSKFKCDERNTRVLMYLYPINFLATATTRIPVLVTAQPSLISNNRDVRINVQSWNTDGQQASNVVFHWRCRVPFYYRIG